MQKLQDWFTQQWVIIRGRKINLVEHAWLIGPFGKVGGIGGAFIDQLAETEGLIVRRGEDSGGLIPSISNLDLSEGELSRLSKPVINFYENTASHSLSLSVNWNPFFRGFGILTNKLFSNRIDQLNIPTRNLEDSESLTSEIIALIDPASNETRYTIWFRTVQSSGQVVYSGVYGTCTLPSGKTGIRAVFPLPNGNATVLMIPEVGENGELILESAGKGFGDAGFYFLLEDSRGNLWSQFIRSFRDRLTVHSGGDHLVAEQELTLFKFRVVTFTYRIVRKET
ncbi:MAG: hypothetical protein ABIP00_01900 [Pyrinomonadaceae bacterium]